MDGDERQRTIDLSIGYTSLGLFGVSIAVLIWFLLYGVGEPERLSEAVERELWRATGGRGDASATFDILLVAAWGFIHSLLARPAVKTRLHRIVPPHLEPAIYSMVASVTLILVCLLYRPIPREVYALEGGPALLATLIFYGGWGLFIYCWFHLNLLEVVGLRPILLHLKGAQRPVEPFRPSGPFLWVRHPVELAFLLAFWATPTMTVGHLLFASVMTIYTFIGIDLEERKMLRLQGAEYVEYVKTTPQILPLPR